MDLTLCNSDINDLIEACQRARQSIRDTATHRIVPDEAYNRMLRYDALIDKLINRQVQGLHPEKGA